MMIWLNGETAESRGALTVADLAECHDLARHTVLVEHNGVALHQREWIERKLSEGDRVEFVRVVAGG